MKLPPSSIDYLKNNNKIPSKRPESIGSLVRETIRKLKEEDENLTNKNIAIFMTPQQRINEWWYYHQHKLYRDYKIHGIQVTYHELFIQNDKDIIDYVSDCLRIQGHTIDDYEIQLVNSYYL